jgi:hypothetical protein
MASVGNGHGGNGHSTRRWNPDDLVRRRPPSDEGTVSGRRFVIAAVIAVLAIWGAIALGFRAWRANYEALAHFGATQVAPLVDPLADRVPPGVDPIAWRQAVADTHAMLLALTGAALLDQPTMNTLRDEIAALVKRATPETAQSELTALWNNLERKAGPVIAPDLTPVDPASRHAARNPRPARPALLKAK